MISKLPKWVGIGAWALAFVGGMVNVVGFLSFEHQAVTHLTGTTSMLGAAIAGERGKDAAELGLVIVSFLAGATLSGFIIQDSALKLGRRYGVVLVLESLLLCVAAALLKAHHTTGMYLAAGACGLQNAMATTYSGSVIRTTHLSGMFTDLGISLGHLLRGLPVEGRRIRIAGIIISAFLAGGVAGAFSFHHLDYNTLFIPAALTGLVGVTYMAYQFTRR
ncbi:MAG TPA: YoaK family protein [Candidatus Saccharimonadia bacterium]|nr:YoaK family protein [Candidatus Saccharimonadia bacterium]